MKLQIITPTGIQYDGEIQRLQFASATGLMEVLPGHAPMIAELKACTMQTDTQGLDVGNGVVRILNDEIKVVCE